MSFQGMSWSESDLVNHYPLRAGQGLVSPIWQLKFSRDALDQVVRRRDVRGVQSDWPSIPYIDQGESGAYLKSPGLKGPDDGSTGESLSYPLLDHEEYTKDYSKDAPC
jgi:hypothetical protein